MYEYSTSKNLANGEVVGRRDNCSLRMRKPQTLEKHNSNFKVLPRNLQSNLRRPPSFRVFRVLTSTGFEALEGLTLNNRQSQRSGDVSLRSGGFFPLTSISMHFLFMSSISCVAYTDSSEAYIGLHFHFSRFV